jgi:hypothetical membrane protein
MTSPREPVLSIRPTSRQVGALGLGSVAVILAGMVLAAVPYRGYAGEAYSPLNHFISELGEIAASPLAWIFNLGIVLGGLGLGVFLLLVSRHMDGRFRLAFRASSVVAGIAGTAVGIFPMDYPTVHKVVSLTFFLSGWIVAAIFGMWQLGRPASGFTRSLLGPAAADIVVSWTFIAVFAGYQPADPNARIVERADVWSVPALEWASLLCLLLWLACLAIVVSRLPEDA